jgi:hypothetical protein
MNITVDLDMLTAALAAGANRDLGSVLLRLTPPPTSEALPPAVPNQVPSVMPSFALVPSSAYEFLFKDTRFLRLPYILERNHIFEFGELLILSSALAGSEDDITPGNEVTPPSVPPNPTPPALTVTKNVIMSSGSVNCDLSAIPDLSTTSKDMKFGVAFKITNASPAVFPMLRMAVGVEFPIVAPYT